MTKNSPGLTLTKEEFAEWFIYDVGANVIGGGIALLIGYSYAKTQIKKKNDYIKWLEQQNRELLYKQGRWY